MPEVLSLLKKSKIRIFLLGTLISAITTTLVPMEPPPKRRCLAGGLSYGLLCIPTDVILEITEYLELRNMFYLACCNKCLYELVTQVNWKQRNRPPIKLKLPIIIPMGVQEAVLYCLDAYSKAFGEERPIFLDFTVYYELDPGISELLVKYLGNHNLVRLILEGKKINCDALGSAGFIEKLNTLHLLGTSWCPEDPEFKMLFKHSVLPNLRHLSIGGTDAGICYAGGRGASWLTKERFPNLCYFDCSKTYITEDMLDSIVAGDLTTLNCCDSCDDFFDFGKFISRGLLKPSLRELCIVGVEQPLKVFLLMRDTDAAIHLTYFALALRAEDLWHLAEIRFLSLIKLALVIKDERLDCFVDVMFQEHIKPFLDALGPDASDPKSLGPENFPRLRILVFFCDELGLRYEEENEGECEWGYHTKDQVFGLIKKKIPTLESLHASNKRRDGCELCIENFLKL